MYVQASECVTAYALVKNIKLDAHSTSAVCCIEFLHTGAAKQHAAKVRARTGWHTSSHSEVVLPGTKQSSDTATAATESARIVHHVQNTLWCS